MRIGMVAVTLVTLSGCATGMPSPDEAMAQVRASLLGREIGHAFAVYGPADGQTTIKGHTVYLWRHSRSMNFSRPETTVKRGTVGDGTQYPYSASVPYVEYSTAQAWQTETYQCVLSVGTDANGVIDDAALNGKMGACMDFVR